MQKQLTKKQESEKLLCLDNNYTDFLKDIKNRLKTAQIRAALAANRELIRFYWQLGADLIEKQKTFKWGDQFLEQFSHDMQQAFPEMQGFSVRNLQRMRQFAIQYPNLSIATQAVSQLPWGHVTRLMQMVKDEQVRDWYAQQTIKNGWSRSVLELQIQSGLYEHQGEPQKKIKAPIGISEYQLSKALPKELKSSLPTIEQIETELNEMIDSKKS